MKKALTFLCFYFSMLPLFFFATSNNYYSLSEKIKTEVDFIRNLSKLTSNNIYLLKDDFLEFCSCERFSTICDPIGCDNFKIIISEFFSKKFDKINQIISELKKDDEIVLEEKIRTLAFLSTLLESYLIQVLDLKRGTFSNFKIGFEIALFIYDLSKFSTDRLFWVLEKYHQELLFILNKYVEDIDFEEDSSYGENNVFFVLKKIKNRKPWLFGILSCFFLYGIYKYKNMNYEI